MLIAVSQVARIWGIYNHKILIQISTTTLHLEYTQFRKGGQRLTLVAAGSLEHLHLSLNGTIRYYGEDTSDPDHDEML
jgi:hypothetical protein